MTTTPALDEQAEAEIFSLLKTIRDLDGLDITDDEIRDGHHRIEGYVWLAEHAYRFGIERERDAAREELAKTRRELERAHAESDMWMGQLEALTNAANAYQKRTEAEIAHLTRERDEVQLWLAPKTREVFAKQWAEKRAEANPATTAEPAALPLLPDIAHTTTTLPDDDAPPMAVGIIPICARCDAPMFVGHRCLAEAEPADEPKATVSRLDADKPWPTAYVPIVDESQHESVARITRPKPDAEPAAS